MVLANRLKLVHLLLIILATTSCLAEESFLENCNADKSLFAFLEEDSSWEVVRESGTFSPILGLRIFDSKLWINTYGADFFPVAVKSERNSILIENIRFLRPAPGKIENDPAELVREYVSEGTVFTIPLIPIDCNIQSELQIDITDHAGVKKETLDFVRL